MSKEYDYERISEEINKLDVKKLGLESLPYEAERIGIPMDILSEILNGIMLSKSDSHITPKFIKSCLERNNEI